MDQRWREQAACIGMDTDMFLTVARGYMPIEALRVCVGCPVRRDCLEAALELSQYDDLGVWGGTTGASRRRIRYGRMTRDQAMRLGDVCASRPTRLEREEAA